MDRIHVSVRARPLSTEDAKLCSWRVSGNSICLPHQSSKFEFDRIFTEDSTTEDVYRARTRDIVAGVLGGFNGTVFAYGQTSSGKTHTMRGTSSNPGVIPLAVSDLFEFTHKDIDREYLLRMSYMEIYNEEINDLLAPEHRRLQIHECLERGIFVAGLKEEVVASADQVLKLMEFGEAHRHIGETNMNLYSSRSHTIFRMIIESRERATADVSGAEFSSDAVRVSVLNLVDLAGSERVSKSGAEGVRLKEGSHINKSLMTLGTVIKKLSEGAESQGGHVPYRDSKLTRILQPALGGNANTAIICNITLAQIHVDETKSSLQFASRALRVTNCAHVNEILSDAALLKRQKQEIEKLRAKLQGLRSECLEEETLNLRNILLQSELERERIALELEEEKRAQAERDKRLQEQAKKIENLSSMVFCVSKEESQDFHQKAKRRDTWCPGNLTSKKLKEVPCTNLNASEVKSSRTRSTSSQLHAFEELVEPSITELSECDTDQKENTLQDCNLPAPHALLHVTSRRKIPQRKRSLYMENKECDEMLEEYEKLLLNFETHRIVSDIKIDYLTRKLSENEPDLKSIENSISHLDGNRSLRDSGAIFVIKKLQEKIAYLEIERCSSQQKLDRMLDLATEHSIPLQEKYEKLDVELTLVQQEAISAVGEAASAESCMGESEWLRSLLSQVHEMKLEFEKSSQLIASLFSAVDEVLCLSCVMPNLITDFRASASDCSCQIELMGRTHEKVQSCLRKKVNELMDEKNVFANQVVELRSRIEELSLEVKKSDDAYNELIEKHDAERFEFLCQFEVLQKEIVSLSSTSLAKEKEGMRKDLERTKAKLKDTESKLKNSVQEKTKLEGEKSCVERELKRLQSQKALLERDINKRESIIGRKCNPAIEKNSNVAELEDEYKKLEVLAFEMEATIASLEDQLAMEIEEKDMSISRADNLESKLLALTEELYQSNSELSFLKEEVSTLRTGLEESMLQVEKAESSLRTLSEEKDDLSMQLAEALMAMEEEKALSASKEKESIEAITAMERLHSAETASFSEQVSQVRNELEICRKKCGDYEATLEKCVEERCRCNLSKDEPGISNDLDKISPQISNQISRTAMHKEAQDVQSELSVLRDERNLVLTQVEELKARVASTDDSEISSLQLKLEQQSMKLASMEHQMKMEDVNNRKEKTKLRMRVHGCGLKLESYNVRYNELLDEMKKMDGQYREASNSLKKELVSCRRENLSLLNEIVELKVQIAGLQRSN